jgi:AsmA protein
VPAKRRVPARRPQRRGGLAIAGYVLLGVVSLAVAALVFLFVAAPVDIVRDRVIEQVKARTGRDLVVAGPISLSVFPRLAVSLKDVSLSAPEGMDVPPTLVVTALEVELRLWSLLSRQPAVERVTLLRPTIELAVDAAGRRSWETAKVQAPALRGAAPNAGAARPPIAVNLRLVDATVHYRDHRSGSHSEIGSLDLTLAADNPSTAVEMAGSLVANGAQLTVAGTASPLSALLSKEPAQVSIRITGAPFEAAYEGVLSLGEGFALEGMLNVKAPSARALGDWLGRPLPPGTDADAVTALATLKVAQGQVSLSGLDARVGDAAMTGTLALGTDKGRQHLSGSLRLSELDLSRLLRRPAPAPAVTAVPQPAASAPLPPPASTGQPPPAAGSIPPPAPAASAAPAVPAPTARKGWNEEPLNLKILNTLDADLAVATGRLIYRDIKTGPSRLSVALKDGVARIGLEEIELYAGRGRGLLTLDARGDGLVTTANLKLVDVSIGPLLTDALRVSWLEGRGSISLALAGKGLSERQIVEALNGTAEVLSSDGAIVGVDVGKIIRSVQQARLPSLTPSPDEKTPFKELSATFVIANGVAKNSDLKLASTHLQLTGEGVLNLGPREIDYTVRPKINAGEPEPGAVLKIGNLEVPVSIVGPWEKPAFTIKGQEQLTNTIRQIGKNLGSPEVQDALKNLLQGGGEKRVRPRDLLEKLLKEK